MASPTEQILTEIQVIKNQLLLMSKDIANIKLYSQYNLSLGWEDVTPSIIDLTKEGFTQMDMILAGEYLGGVGGIVMEDVTGVAYIDLRVNAALGNQTTLYQNANTFSWMFKIFSKGDGSKKGDSFFLPMNIVPARNIQIGLEITSPALTGKMNFFISYGRASV